MKKSGEIELVAGSGRRGFSGDGGLATDASLDNPGGVAVDEDRNVIIADTYNNRIRGVESGTGVIRTVAGGGTADPWKDNHPALMASLALPTGLAVDTAGNLSVGHSIAPLGHGRFRGIAGDVRRPRQPRNPLCKPRGDPRGARVVTRRATRAGPPGAPIPIAGTPRSARALALGRARRRWAGFGHRRPDGKAHPPGGAWARASGRARCCRIFRITLGSRMKAMTRIVPPPEQHKGSTSNTLARSRAH